MAVEPDDGYLRNPDGQKKLVYSVVDQAIKDGVYVLIDWHDHNAERNLEQSMGFFTEMAKKYSGVPMLFMKYGMNPPLSHGWLLKLTQMN